MKPTPCTLCLHSEFALRGEEYNDVCPGGCLSMTTPSRRDFLKLAGAASAAIAFGDAPLVAAYPLGLPLGLQLYSLRELLPKDFDGTLKAISAAGYTEVEAAGYYAMDAPEFKQSMDAAG